MSVAIVTGANKGLGFETSRQLARAGYIVIMTGRNKELILEAVQRLRSEEGDSVKVEPFVVDVTNQDQIDQLKMYCQEHYSMDIEILVNNAGVYLETSMQYNIFDFDPNLILNTFDINTLGAFRMCQAFIPLMDNHGKGRVVNVSSGMGQLFDMSGGSPAYRLSKVALSGVTRIFAAETKGQHIAVNSVCPGWVKTDMGGSHAPRDVSKGVETIVWLALMSDEEATSGKFFRDKKEIPW